MASRAEKVFKAGLPLSRRGERNVPKKYLKAAGYMPEADEQGYFVYHSGLFIPVEFDFTHCFWYIIKYDNQQSCWVSHKFPKSEYGLEILDSEVTDWSEWGSIDDGKDDSDQSDQEEPKAKDNQKALTLKSLPKRKKRANYS